MHSRRDFLTTVSGILASLVFAAVTGLPQAAMADETGFRWDDRPQQGQCDLYFGKSPVLRYMYDYDASTPERLLETYKVYHHVFGPGSDQIITKGPGGLYTHHRGLYVGWNKTSTSEGGNYDFWHCTKGAHLKHVRFVKQEAGADQATMTAEINWNDADGKPVIVELRTVKVTVEAGSESSPPTWVIDWSTVLTSKRGEIQLSGDRQHAGFQFRAAQPVADSKSARYIRPEGFPQQVEAFQVGDKGDPPAHINLNWLAMTFPLEGQQYTAEYFEAPGQPRPSLYSERPYGRFGAFYKAQVTEEKPLEMQYRVRISAGETPSQESIQQRYDDYTAGLKQQ